ncbi:MAG: metallophosphoesterase [Bacteroidales bacterium]
MIRRRGMLYTGVMLVVIMGCSCHRTPECDFLVASDLHYNGSEQRAMILDSAIRLMNRASSLPFPRAGGRNLDPFGVFVTGDITESGTEEQWNQFVHAFGLKGDRDLQIPVYETFGNHDGNVEGIVREGIRARNKKRAGGCRLSDNGLHYSFNRSGVHFVVLGIYPGNEWDRDCEWCHYFHESFREAQMSLEFLRHDLNHHLRKPDQPVILLFHYGWDDFSRLWWSEKERDRFYEAVKDRNIIGIFHGHDHIVDHYMWRGMNIWSAGSPQSENGPGTFLGVKIRDDGIFVSVCRKDHWELLSAVPAGQ